MFQLQMRISFLLLLAKDLHRFLLIMRTRSFFTLLYMGDTYARLVYNWYNSIFHMIAVLMFYFAANRGGKSDKNNIKTRQRQYRYKTVLLLETR